MILQILSLILTEKHGSDLNLMRHFCTELRITYLHLVTYKPILHKLAFIDTITISCSKKRNLKVEI